MEFIASWEPQPSKPGDGMTEERMTQMQENGIFRGPEDWAVLNDFNEVLRIEDDLRQRSQPAILSG